MLWVKDSGFRVHVKSMSEPPYAICLHDVSNFLGPTINILGYIF